MGLLDPTPPRRTSSSAATPRSDLTGIQLLEAATTAHAHAEQEFDRSPETREDLEHAYLAAAHALGAESHPDRAVAWLGVATVRRYQKGRRADTLTAFDEALTADPDRIPVWDAYFDYITYAVSAAALLAIVERMPAPIRARNLSAVMAVAHGTDRWGTMSPDDQQQFRTALPGLLDALDDRPSLGARRCCVDGSQVRAGWSDAPSFCHTGTEVGLRRVPFSARSDHGRGALVPALRVVLPRRRRTPG